MRSAGKGLSMPLLLILYGDTSVSLGLTVTGLIGDATYDVGILDANGAEDEATLLILLLRL